MTQENPEHKNPTPDGADPVGTADTADTLDTLRTEHAADPAGARGRPAAGTSSVSHSGKGSNGRTTNLHRAHLRGLGARLRDGRNALSRAIDRAEAARRIARAEQLSYAGIRTPTSEAAPVDAPDSSDSSDSSASAGSSPAPTARVAPLDALPSWLVRGGIGAWLLLGLFIVIALIFYITSWIIPVFIGVFMALVFTSILQPLVNLFARVMPRYPATFLGLLTAVGAVAGLVFYVVTSVTSQWSTLATQFSDGVNTIMDFLEYGPLPMHLTEAEVMGQIQRLVEQGQDYVQSNAPTLATEVLSNASTVVDVFAVLALAIFSTIFFLASGGRMWRWFLNELPAAMRESVHRAASAGWYTFAGYARGTVIVALTDAVMAGIFLQIVGVPLAAPLAVLVFIGAFIPIIGAPIAMIIAMVVALASKGFITMIVVGLGVAGIGQIEGHILQPLIMGRQVSLHPVVVIIAVAVGTYSAGLLGAIVAVPLISVLWSVYSELHIKDAPVVGELPAYSSGKSA